MKNIRVLSMLGVLTLFGLGFAPLAHAQTYYDYGGCGSDFWSGSTCGGYSGGYGGGYGYGGYGYGDYGYGGGYDYGYPYDYGYNDCGCSSYYYPSYSSSYPYYYPQYSNQYYYPEYYSGSYPQYQQQYYLPSSYGYGYGGSYGASYGQIGSWGSTAYGVGSPTISSGGVNINYNGW